MTGQEGSKKKLAVIVAAAVFTVGAVAAAVITGIIPRTSSIPPQQEAAISEPAQTGNTTAIRKHSPAKTRAQATPTARAPVAPPPCANCGVIESIESFTEKGSASGGGAVAGGLIGGILGHQVGKGRGKDLATVAGAVGGAIAGHEMEKNANKVTGYRVGVRMNDGTRELLTLSAPPSVAVGDRVRVVNGEPVRD